ncbi:MTAP family purine nucleoside phosphorylase [Patescibacteria group bacterium]|nr:MTAP family purine nucleoside phosphorylase [Patescibacteria group bacterium]
MESRRSIGIIGGSGFEQYPELLVERRVVVSTPYGFPSDELLIGKVGDTDVVFLPRHGADHRIAPHRIPYKANLAAMKSFGVSTVLSTCIVGSLKKTIEPGFFVVPDQFVNFTSGRDADSVESDGSFVHLPMALPYCQALRIEMIRALQRAVGSKFQGDGTVVVIQGPRFSTTAESKFFIRNEWDIVNMTQYPECLFARELGMCYATLASVTDWDVGVGESLSMKPETMDQVLDIFRKNTQVTRQVIGDVLSQLSAFTCGCANAVVTEYYKRR